MIPTEIKIEKKAQVTTKIEIRLLLGARWGYTLAESVYLALLDYLISTCRFLQPLPTTVAPQIILKLA